MDQSSGLGRESRDEAATVAHVEQRGVAKAPDPVVTIGAVQRYVDAERSRNRRTVLWTSTVFLLVFLLIVVVFIAVGIVLLRSSNQTSSTVESVQSQTAVYAMEVVGISNRITGVESAQSEMAEKAKDAEQKRYRESEQIKADLEKFSQWVESRTASKLLDATAVDARIRQLEESAAAGRKELEEVQKRYDALKALALSGEAAVSQGAASVTSQAVSLVSGPPPPPPDALAAEPPDADDATADAADKILDASKHIAAEELEVPGPGTEQREISVVTFPNGDRYEGEFRDGLMNGWGMYAYQNGDRYEGQFKDDAKEGRGTFAYRNGDRYAGNFVGDLRHGKGSLAFRNGERYVGQFCRDMMTGSGSMIYTNGNRYAGQFQNGLKHGNGIMTYPNGDVFKGAFRNDVRQGKGVYIFSDGSRYVGDFKDGRRHGKGVYVYSGGEQYAGSFVNGRKDGDGVLTYPNGKSVKGTWKDDRLVTALPQE